MKIHQIKCSDKESGCNAGDPSSILGSGRPPGEGTGCPLQYSWASLVAQLVKNPPAVQETWVPPLGCEDKGNSYPIWHSGLENSMDKRAWQATVHGVTVRHD